MFLFDLEPGRPPAAQVARPLRGHEQKVSGLGYAPDGTTLVTLDIGGVVKQWATAEKRPVLKSPLGPRGKYSPNSTVVLTGERPGSNGTPDIVVRVCELRYDTRGGQIRVHDGAGRSLWERDLPIGHVDDLAMSPDGKRIALVWHRVPDFIAFVWDAATGAEVRRLTWPSGGYARVALSPEGTRLAATTTDYPNSDGIMTLSLRVWELGTGREVFARSGFSREFYATSAFAPDGRRLACAIGAARTDEAKLAFFDTATWREDAVVPLGSRRVSVTAFSRDGRKVALACTLADTTTVEVYDVAALVRGDPAKPGTSLTGINGDNPRVEFGPDGRRLLTSRNGSIKLWDSATGREVLTLTGPLGLSEAHFSPDGRTIWAGLDETSKLWGWDATPLLEAKAP